MRKIWKRLVICGCLAGMIWTWGLLVDRARLRENLIRLHIVANSDSEADQTVKLQVRDAILSGIQEDLANISDVEQARDYLQENLTKIKEIASHTLEAAGVDQDVVVTLCEEAFDIRNYDTFSLPSGVYESLRIVIGDGAGKNWWCVSFPSLCLGATSAEFQDQAVDAGLSRQLTAALAGEESYQFRFYLLDRMGEIENFIVSHIH